jgi:hypothetical protein
MASFPLFQSRRWRSLPRERAILFAFLSSAANRAMTPAQRVLRGDTRLMPVNRRPGSGFTATELVEVRPVHPADRRYRVVDTASPFFSFEQSPLPFHAPPIPRKRSAGPYNAMTRDNKRHAIHSAGPSHCPRSIRFTHLSRDVAVTARLSARNLAQRLPHPQLKHRTAQVKCSGQTATLREI